MSEHVQTRDVLIVGAGPAGLTAGIYSAWLGLKTLILEAVIAGGRAEIVPRIQNFPGFEEEIAGRDLAEKMKKQAIRLGAKLQVPEEVIDIDVKSEPKKVTTREATYEALAIIIATGTQRKKLRVKGEEEFLGRGVSYCAVCDGPFFKNADVAVIGSSEGAVTDAAYLSEVASKVIIVTQNIETDVLSSKLKSKHNIEIVKGKVTAIKGEQVVNKIKITDPAGQQITEKEVKGVFIALGEVPMTTIVKNAGIHTDQNGCLIVDRQQRTNIEGVFAAGDCTCGGMQIATAAGEGAMAAMQAVGYIRRKKPKKEIAKR